MLLFWLFADVIVERNIFCSGCSAQARPLPRIELLSTLVCPADPAWSRALLRDADGMRLVAPGARMGPARLERVLPTSVWLTLDGKSWRIFLEPPAADVAGPRCRGERCTLPRAEVERMLAHPELLGARAVATPEGFVLRLVPGSPLQKLGLRDGDRLRAIDGTVLDGMEAVLHLWPKLRRASRFTLSLVREGRPLTYEVVVD
jgi:hypothetical protein